MPFGKFLAQGGRAPLHESSGPAQHPPHPRDVTSMLDLLSSQQHRLHDEDRIRPVQGRESTPSSRAGSNSQEGSPRRTEQPAPTPAPARSHPEEDIITIHVCDEQNNTTRDFYCPRPTLLAGMEYFKEYLQNCSSEDIDISVHCDVDIFEWLMSYITETKAPELTVSHVVSILISSDFLRMAPLVEKCLNFIHQHLQEVIRLPIDLDCIQGDIFNRLADMLSIDEADRVRDRRNKLMDRVFERKTMELVRNPSTCLFHCTACGKLFTVLQKEWMVCALVCAFVSGLEVALEF
mgnify:FL=1